eukprot:gnl/TRDRNA2_/TRDRNA2_75814_c0_seq4.p2 gnl/TRDRNA2_/TRDRNA2_75814_c0~~gnl/TRDRNA2_/TRDRNA2_75814_c0_seq4.p2  ORF type:complete len:151 (+),score=42.03 gnl/TRDRNA2_/TRDRNA2_75814_c0_seq4:340-792(+)
MFVIGHSTICLNSFGAIDAKEKEEEEQFWAGVRARRMANGETADDVVADGSDSQQRIADDAIEEDPTLPLSVRKHYQALGVMGDATDSEVRKAYRKLALKHHPDKNPKDVEGAKKRFTELAHAYEAVCEYLASAESTASRRSKFAPPKNY